MSIKKSWSLSLLSLLLLYVGLMPTTYGASTTSTQDADICSTNTKVRKHYINVSVATLWKQPGLERTIDAPSLSSPVDIKKWTSAMSSVTQRRWLTGKTETQALYGQEVRMLQVKGDWAQVAVVGQSTPKSKYGYPGWLPKAQVSTLTTADYSSCPTAIVSAKTANLYASDMTTKGLEVSFNTRFPVIATSGNWLQVWTPAEDKVWILKSDTVVYDSLSDIPKPTATELIATGKQFLGLPYLWAGISAYGFDCSGFTSTVYGYYGIALPRDASAQIKEGTPVSWSNLQPGDLMFFATNNGKGSVHHVSMYIGNGQMMHSPKAGKTVEIISINTASYAKEFAGARRYLD